MRFDWILFDADDTLLDFVQSAQKAFSSMLLKFEVMEEDGHYPLYLECNHEAWRGYEEGRIDSQTLRRQRFACFQERARLLIRQDPAEMNRVFLEELIQHTFPLDGALELLKQLDPQVKLGIITNGLKEVQRPRIRHAGMEGYFPVVVVSDEIGLAKPDPRFFSYAHEAMGKPAKERVLVVGDSLASDIQGARNFDFRSCWFNPHGKTNPHPWRPDFEIQDLQQVNHLLF